MNMSINIVFTIDFLRIKRRNGAGNERRHKARYGQREAKANIKNARAMKAEGLALKMIARITSLPIEEIDKL